MRIPALNSFVGVLILFIFLVSSANATHVSVTEDAYVEYWRNLSNPGAVITAHSTNYGNNSTLSIWNSATNIERYTFIKFRVPEYTSAAYLNIYAVSGYDSARGTYIYPCSNDWSESSVTWDNKPSYIGSTQIGYTVINNTVGWYNISLGSYVSYPGNYSICIKTTGGDRTNFTSTENISYAPFIEIIPGTQPVDIISNNKTNNDTRAFLVEPSDCIQFSINPDTVNVSSYSWYVNKTAQASTANTLNFTVPAGTEGQPSTEIWEIRSHVNYSNGTKLYREWLISSLPESEAPDFIDFFVDLNNVQRSANAIDPWGRDLPYYPSGTNYIATGFLTGTDYSSSDNLVTSLDTTYGTFRYKIRDPGVSANYNFIISGTNSYDYGAYAISNEYHDYYRINHPQYGYTPISRRWLGQAPSFHNWQPDGWREITLIHTQDGWWSAWDNGSLIPGNFQNFIIDSNSTSLAMGSDSTLEFDCVEIYTDLYLYPSATARYILYPKWWYISDAGTGYSTPVEEIGIVAIGHDLTLQNISDYINNESLMTYNTETKTATVNTNLFIEAGSVLNVTDETLLFNTSSDSLDINLMIHSEFNVENSTISTVGNNPIRWNLASAIAMSVFDPITTRNLTTTSQKNNERYNPKYDFSGRFIIQNSTINNTCNLYLDGPTEVVLNNVVFSNHSNSDYGDYTPRGEYNAHNNLKIEGTGTKSLWVSPRNDLYNFEIDNISFINPKETPNMRVNGGEWILNSTTIKNSNITNVNISAAQAWKPTYFISYWNLTEHCDFSLLNCLYNESLIDVPTPYAKLETKYYTDVVVKNGSGYPVPNATITFTPSNAEYDAESLYEYNNYFRDRDGDLNATGPGTGGASNYAPGYYDENGTLVGNAKNITYGGGTWIRWWNAQELTSATTDENGVTALPIGDVNNSIVLTDEVFSNATGTQTSESITYTLTITADGYNETTVQNINPDQSWYSSDVSDVHTISVTMGENVSSAPVANITADVISGAYPLYVNFTDVSTNSPAAWEWDFDNNGVIDSRTQNPRAKYKAPGNYTVNFTVSNGFGSNTTTKTAYIHVTGTEPTRKPTHTDWGYFWNNFYQIFFGA